ncbi:hypothetical protein QUB63_11385 [Microcoleus sp. ARI1-B5]|uniref:hypothetical protein n=1 Tax=unclassified Microcoleus TaxID=2642155 RepID=UPI002FD55697
MLNYLFNKKHIDQTNIILDTHQSQKPGFWQRLCTTAEIFRLQTRFLAYLLRMSEKDFAQQRRFFVRNPVSPLLVENGGRYQYNPIEDGDCR